MNKVVTINLNGRAYQLEESGYEALRMYLDNASANLADDPGKAEIVADLEQAIAEKCDKVLSPHKTVVSSEEVKKIIDEMGPVEGDAKKDDGAKHEQKSGPRAPRRLFLIREDAVFAGVCAGIAAYFDIDVTIIRVAFVALTVFTGGVWILLYIALALLVPYADTAEAMAQAHGEPFNAEALVQRAKERWGESYERVTGNKWDDLTKGMGTSHEQHLKWREIKRQKRQQWKQQWKQSRMQRRQWNPVYGLLRALIAVFWIVALVSLIRTGAVFGWMVPGLPVWLAVVLLFIVFFMITGPLQAAQYGPYGMNDPLGKYYYSDPWDGFVGVLIAIFLVIAFVWAYGYVPQFYAFVHHPITGFHEAVSQVQLLWQQR